MTVSAPATHRGPIRVQTISDLHAEHDAARLPGLEEVATAADIVVVAGDTARSADSVRLASDLFPEAPVLVLVGGNHEHYNTAEDIDTGLALMAREAERLSRPGHQIVVLENQAASVLVGQVTVRILGCTLWTDYALFDDPDQDRMRVSMGLNDYRAIRGRRDGNGQGILGGQFPVTTHELLERHQESVRFLAEQLTLPHDGPTIVVTHHLPSMRSVSKTYRRQRVSAGFASKLDHLVALGATLWLHGHTHTSCNWRDDNGTLVVCNPMGYSRDTMVGWQRENEKFNPRLVIDIRRGAPDGAWHAGRARKTTAKDVLAENNE